MGLVQEFDPNGALGATQPQGFVRGGSRDRRSNGGRSAGTLHKARQAGLCQVWVPGGALEREIRPLGGQVAPSLQREGLGRSDVERRIGASDTKTEVIRTLRHRLSDEVFRRLMIDELDRAAAGASLTPVAA
jgi:hypothetical protein